MEAVHLASPMSFNAKGVAKALIQGSAEEKQNCVDNIAVCEPGFREDLPAFGVPQPLFETVPLDTEPIKLAIERWEPRAELTITESEGTQPSDRKIVVEVQ